MKIQFPTFATTNLSSAELIPNFNRNILFHYITTHLHLLYNSQVVLYNTTQHISCLLFYCHEIRTKLHVSLLFIRLLICGEVFSLPFSENYWSINICYLIPPVGIASFKGKYFRFKVVLSESSRFLLSTIYK